MHLLKFVVHFEGHGTLEDQVCLGRNYVFG